MLKRVPKLEQKLWRLLMLPFRMFVLVVSPTIYLSYLLGAPLVNSFNGLALVHLVSLFVLILGLAFTRDSDSIFIQWLIIFFGVISPLFFVVKGPVKMLTNRDADIEFVQRH